MRREEEVVLVDESGGEVGLAERTEAHRGGALHRAVSVFVFNPGGELLLQRRVSSKALFGGKWANSCCTHPRPGEDTVSAGERRLMEEIGLRATLRQVGTFIYQARDPLSGLIEHEYDHVLTGVSEGQPSPDPAEVDRYRWVDVGQLRHSIRGDSLYAPWLEEALDAFPDLGAGL